MAINQSKKFLREMAQPFEQSEKSLWGIEQVRMKQMNLSEPAGGDEDAIMFEELPDAFFARMEPL